MSGSGISWTICKSAPRSRQITMPAPHHSVFLQARCPCCCPTNSVKALKATTSYITLSTNAVGINGSLCLCIDSQKKLVTWLRILLRNTWLIEYYYQPWSYVVKTGKSRLIIMTLWFIFVSYNLLFLLLLRLVDTLLTAKVEDEVWPRGIWACHRLWKLI